MGHKYLPQTDSDIAEMLSAAGVGTLQDLYADVPEALKLNKDYDLPSAMSEHEVRKTFALLLKKNKVLTCFAGGGVYDHYVPAVSDYITSRSEFLTSYTPYQAEFSQGTLQYIFEYQTMMALLTGMDISNASLYDGATATAEAMMTALAVTKKKSRILLSSTLNPRVIRVVETYAKFRGIRLTLLPEINGVTNLNAMRDELSKGDVAGVILPEPNYYGIVEDFSGVADDIHSAKAVMIVNCIPVDLAYLKTPGEWGADIAVGSAQSLGLPMSYGGPYLGFFCSKKEYLRKIPGRIVGATVDSKGKRAFCLTMQTREQHIRREKATSNICSNQGIMTLYVAIYLSLMGKKGLQEAAKKSYIGAHYLYDSLLRTGKFVAAFPGLPFFKEFCVEAKFDLDKWNRICVQNDIMGGIRVGDSNRLLFAVTEIRTKEEIDKLISLSNLL